MPIKTALKKYYLQTLFLSLTFFVAISLFNAKNDSPTYDEIAHIPAGYSYIEEHQLRLNPEHPPLLKVLSALPLKFINPPFDTNQKFWSNINDQWDAGRYLIYENPEKTESIIFWSRIPIIILSAFFGLFLFFWVKKLAGIPAGLFAFILYQFDPNILGHNHFVTTDLGVAIFFAIFFYFFLDFLKNPSWKNTIFTGISLGLLHIAKFSSVIIVPIFIALIVIYPIAKNKGLHQKTKQLFSCILKGSFIFILSIFVIWIAYFFISYSTPKNILPEIANHPFYFGQDTTYNNNAKFVVKNLDRSSITRPLAGYAIGLAMVFKRVSEGNATYFFGKIHTEEKMYGYYPIIFILKETISFLLLLAIALFFSFTLFYKKIKENILKLRTCNKTPFSMLFVKHMHSSMTYLTPRSANYVKN